MKRKTKMGSHSDEIESKSIFLEGGGVFDCLQINIMYAVFVIFSPSHLFSIQLMSGEKNENGYDQQNVKGLLPVHQDAVRCWAKVKSKF